MNEMRLAPHFILYCGSDTHKSLHSLLLLLLESHCARLWMETPLALQGGCRFWHQWDRFLYLVRFPSIWVSDDWYVYWIVACIVFLSLCWRVSASFLILEPFGRGQSPCTLIMVPSGPWDPKVVVAAPCGLKLKHFSTDQIPLPTFGHTTTNEILKPLSGEG